jgi:uncharacterized protein (TIRG00374 family)
MVDKATFMKRYLRLTAGIVISAVCLLLAFRGVGMGELWRLARSLPVPLVLLYSGVASTSLVLRGARWKVLLAGAGPLPFSTVLAVNCAGQMGNAVLPARLGDLFRATNLTRSGVSGGFSLATIFVERVLDTGFLVLLAAAALRGVGALPPWLLRASSVVAVAALAGLGFALTLPLLEAPLLRLARRLLPARWHVRATALIEQFVLGLRSLHRVRTVLAFLVLTVAVWSLDGFGIWVLAGAAGLALTAPVIALLLTSLALSSAIPAAPGNAGVYQIVAVTVLAPFGAAHAPALLFAVTWQALIVINVLAWGLASLWFLSSRELLVTDGFRGVAPIVVPDLVLL